MLSAWKTNQNIFTEHLSSLCVGDSIKRKYYYSGLKDCYILKLYDALDAVGRQK